MIIQADVLLAVPKLKPVLSVWTTKAQVPGQEIRFQISTSSSLVQSH